MVALPNGGVNSTSAGAGAGVTPSSLDTVKQMFDSATLLRMENENPFKGNRDLNRTKNNRFVPRNYYVQ